MAVRDLDQCRIGGGFTFASAGQTATCIVTEKLDRPCSTQYQLDIARQASYLRTASADPLPRHRGNNA
jgi:hypothetical protein